MALLVGTPTEIGVEESRVEEFFARHWPRQISLADHGFADWQFAQTPRSNGTNRSIIAYDSAAGSIAGVMGLTPRPFYLSAEELNGAELTTWIVAEDYRAVGAGAKILTEIMSRYDVLIGMGISSMALPIYLRSGFRYLRAIPRFIRVLNVENAARVGSITAVGRKLQRLSPTGPVQYQVSTDVSEDLFKRVSKSLNLFDRSHDFLNWRYRRHPSFSYNLHAVRTGGGEALVALRVEDSIEQLKVLHVLDCVGDDAAMPAAISFIEDHAKSIGADFCDFYSTAASVNRFFIASGWHSTVDDLDVQLPHLFHPLELRTPPTTSLIYWARHRMVEIADFGKLYISKQDADFDRPVPA